MVLYRHCNGILHNLLVQQNMAVYHQVLRTCIPSLLARVSMYTSDGAVSALRLDDAIQKLTGLMS